LRLLGCFAAVALALAALGLHGLLAFTLSTRLPEIGVRMALGATPRDILRLVLRQGLLQAGLGLALGVALALVGGRVLQALLAGVSPADVAAYGAAVLLSLGAVLAGSFLPALRAVRVDPTKVLRE
jgi:ABC-type antimicrobial peptide transport system permease subunit